MPRDDEQLERLILRRLHREAEGSAGADERELNERLRVDVSAQALMSDYRQIDARAAEAMDALLSRGADADEVARRAWAADRPRPADERRAASRRWWIAPAALAASVALGLLIPTAPWVHDSTRNQRVPLGQGWVEAPAKESELPGRGASGGAALSRPVADGPHATHRSTDRELVGVMGRDGRTIYFLQIDRTRTSRVQVEPSEHSGEPGGL